MIKLNIKRFSLIVAIVLVLFVTLNVIKEYTTRPNIVIIKQDSALNINKNFIKLFSAGNKRLISSIIWIQTLLESDIGHYKQKNLNSWMFHRFDTITTLDPDFYWAYLFGGQYLSVIKDDDFGAEVIYSRGLKKFPDDYWLNFYGGFHYFFELEDLERAYIHYSRIQDHPITKKQHDYLPALVARLKAQQGSLEMAYKLMETAYQNTPEDSRQKKRFGELLYSIKAELDLKCLNEKNDSCELYDLSGKRYIKGQSGNYIAQKKWIPFRLMGKWKKKR